MLYIHSMLLSCIHPLHCAQGFLIPHAKSNEIEGTGGGGEEEESRKHARKKTHRSIVSGQ